MSDGKKKEEMKLILFSLNQQLSVDLEKIRAEQILLETKIKTISKS